MSSLQRTDRLLPLYRLLLALASLAFACGGATACGGPTPPGQDDLGTGYVLVSVNGQSLPAVMDEGDAPTGPGTTVHWVNRVIEQSLDFNGQGQFATSGRCSFETGGQTMPQTGAASGRYLRSGNTVTFTFDAVTGVSQTRTVQGTISGTTITVQDVNLAGQPRTMLFRKGRD